MNKGQDTMFENKKEKYRKFRKWQKVPRRPRNVIHGKFNLELE